MKLLLIDPAHKLSIVEVDQYFVLPDEAITQPSPWDSEPFDSSPLETLEPEPEFDPRQNMYGKYKLGRPVRHGTIKYISITQAAELNNEDRYWIRHFADKRIDGWSWA